MSIESSFNWKHSVSQHAQVRQTSQAGRIRTAVTGLCVLVISCLLPGSLAAAATNPDLPAPAVAVASSFRGLWPSLTEAYVDETGHKRPRASFASSGLLSTQILHGAPFELFLSANLETVERLRQAGKAPDTGISIASGTLSLIKRHNDNHAEPANLQQLAADLVTNRSTKLAMPNPRHAPYGMAARQLLTNAGIWPLPSGTLLAAENASQSLQYALSGAAAYAVVPTTLVTPPPESLHAATLPDDMYEAVDHRAVQLSNSTPAAEAFLVWLQSPTATAVLRRFGLSTIELRLD